jgi:hypothetical protein
MRFGRAGKMKQADAEGRVDQQASRGLPPLVVHPAGHTKKKAASKWIEAAGMT